MTEVVNVKRHHADVFIGRPSRFGNPFRIGPDGPRATVIEKYRIWFYRQLARPEFKAAVLELKDKKLGCFCSPEHCHGDVIAEYLNNL